jgi:hypothetical protein
MEWNINVLIKLLVVPTYCQYIALQSKNASKNQLLLLNHILYELNFTRLDVLIFKLLAFMYNNFM